MAYFQLRPTAMIEEAARRWCQPSAPFRIDQDHTTRSLTDFPVGDSPSVGHPVGDVRAPVPCSLRWRDWVEVGIGSVLRGSEAALLLTDLKAELGYASSEARHLSLLDRFVDDLRWSLLLEGVLLVEGRHAGLYWSCMTGITQSKEAMFTDSSHKWSFKSFH